MKSRAPFLLLTIAALTLHAWPANATIVLESSIEDMTRLSALVVHAEVQDVSMRKDGPAVGPTRIVTDVTLRLRDTMKGAADGETLTLTLPGGQAGEYVMLIPGMPQFHPGEEVVLFLEKTRDGYVPSGLQQGRFSILREPTTGDRVAVRTYDAGIALARRGAKGGLDIEHVEDRVDLRYLDDLKGQIRATVARFGPLPEIPRDGVLPSVPTVERPAPATP